MSAFVLDAGVLIAVDRDDRAVALDLRAMQRSELELRTHPLVVAQAWRGGERQVRLARFLAHVKIESLGEKEGRAAGELMARAGTSDPVDAALVVIANPGDRILSDDAADIRRLVAASGRALRVVPTH